MVDYRVPGIVPAIFQGAGTNRCWAACTTMLVSWKEQASYSMAAVIGRYGEPWITYYTQDTGLPTAEAGQFFAAVGMATEPPRNYTLNGWVGLLQDFGPVIVGSDFSGADGLDHMVVLLAIKGDGSPNGTTFFFNDPAAGAETSLT